MNEFDTNRILQRFVVILESVASRLKQISTAHLCEEAVQELFRARQALYVLTGHASLLVDAISHYQEETSIGPRVHYIHAVGKQLSAISRLLRSLSAWSEDVDDKTGPDVTLQRTLKDLPDVSDSHNEDLEPDPEIKMLRKTIEAVRSPAPQNLPDPDALTSLREESTDLLVEITWLLESLNGYIEEHQLDEEFVLARCPHCASEMGFLEKQRTADQSEVLICPSCSMRFEVTSNMGRIAGTISGSSSAEVSRVLREIFENVQKESNPPICILLLSANPKDAAPRRLDDEMRLIDGALRQSELRDRFDMQQHRAVRVSDLQSLFLRHRPDIVHFSGHGTPKSEIILEDNFGRSLAISTRALSRLFSVLRDNIKCVVLNACHSEVQARAIAEHIDCVIGMSKAISDESAINFTTSFYQALGFGRDVKTAFDLACLQIDLEDLGEEDTPKLIAATRNPETVFLAERL